MEIAFYILGNIINLLLLFVLLPTELFAYISGKGSKITPEIFFYYFGGKVVYFLSCFIVSIFMPTFVIAIFMLILSYYLKKRK